VGAEAVSGVDLDMARRIVFLPIPKPSQVMVDRDFPDEPWWSGRKVVCRRCHLVMVDCEPSTRCGEFYHHASPHQTRALRCRNDRQQFCTEDKEIMPFLRKARRRYLKRAGIHP
jgi:hypothetical protein